MFLFVCVVFRVMFRVGTFGIRVIIFFFFGKKSVECVQSHLLCACASCRQFNARLRKTDQTERLLDESFHSSKNLRTSLHFTEVIKKY